MGKVFTLALKDLRILFRDKGSLFWVILFPLLIALFFGTIFSGGGGQMSGMDIALVNNDKSDFSAEYIKELNNISSLNVREMPYDSAFDLVRRGKLSAFVVLEKGFGNSIGIFSDSGKISIGMDPSRKITAGFLNGMLTQALFTTLQKQFSNRQALQSHFKDVVDDVDNWAGLNQGQKDKAKDFFSSMSGFISSVMPEDSLADTTDTAKAEDSSGGMANLLKINTISVINDEAQPRSSFEVTFPSAILWGLLGCAATFAVSIVRERTAGTFLRLRLAPLTRAQILAGKGLACFIASISVCILLLLIGVFIFGVRISEPVILLIAILTTSFCFVGLMMVISVLGKTEEAVGGAGWGILLVLAMAGGGMLPVMFMPDWLKTISNFSPIKWGIISIEGGIWRQYTYSEIALPAIVLIAIGVVCFSIGVMVLSRSDS